MQLVQHFFSILFRLMVVVFQKKFQPKVPNLEQKMMFLRLVPVVGNNSIKIKKRKTVSGPKYFQNVPKNDLFSPDPKNVKKTNSGSFFKCNQIVNFCKIFSFCVV